MSIAKVKKARLHPCSQEASIAVLEQMARINCQDHAEMKADLKILVSFRWKILATIATITFASSGMFTFLLAYYFGR